MTTGQKIRQLLDDNDMKIIDLAYFMDYQQTGTIYRWVSDLNIPRLDLLQKMCDVFRITLADFFDGVEVR